MFAGCISLTSINLSNFNCDKIENTNGMIDMFKDCKSLKIKNIEYIDFKIRSQIIIDLYIS
jgi:surface protein